MSDQQTQKKSQDFQIVVFKLRNEEFGADITSVTEISRMLDITRLPQAPGFIEGLINLRGQVIAVIDLARQFGLRTQWEAAATARIIVVQVGTITVGLMVDEVPGVIRIGEEDVQPTPAILQSRIHKDYIRGVAKLKDRLIILLDLKRVLGGQELDRVEEVGQTNMEAVNG